MLRKRKTAALWLLAGVCLLASSCGVSPSADPNNTQPSIRPNVKTATVEREDVSYKTVLTATLVPTTTINLFFKDVSGPLKSLQVGLMDTISEGKEIAALDPVEVQESIDRQDLQRQLWELREKNQTNSERSYQISVDQAKDTYNYALELYKEDPSAANKEYRDRCKRAVDQAQLNQDIFKVNRQIFKLEYQDFKESFELLKEKLDHCSLLSPGDGIVTYVTDLTVEERVPAGTHIARFVQFKDMVLKAPDATAASLRGQKDIQVIHGDKTYLAYAYEPEQGDPIWKTEGAAAVASSVYLAFQDAVPEIVINATAPIEVKIDKKGALVVNKKCIHTVNGVQTVDLLQDGAYVTRIVECGLVSGDSVEILSGLVLGDVVALS